MPFMAKQEYEFVQIQNKKFAERFEFSKWFGSNALYEGVRVGEILVVRLVDRPLRTMLKEGNLEVTFRLNGDDGGAELLGQQVMRLAKGYLFRLREPKISLYLLAIPQNPNSRFPTRPVNFLLASTLAIARIDSERGMMVG